MLTITSQLKTHMKPRTGLLHITTLFHGLLFTSCKSFFNVFPLNVSSALATLLKTLFHLLLKCSPTTLAIIFSDTAKERFNPWIWVLTIHRSVEPHSVSLSTGNSVLHGGTYFKTENAMHETQAANILLLSVNLIIIFLTHQFCK